jgi:hypothetical protein
VTALLAAKGRAEDLERGIASNRPHDAVKGRACVSAASTQIVAGKSPAE